MCKNENENENENKNKSGPQEIVVNLEEIKTSFFAKICALIRRNKIWILIVATMITIAMGLSLLLTINSGSLDTSQTQIAELTKKTEQLASQYRAQQQIVADLQQRIITLQQANNAMRKEAINNAYIKAHSVPDAEFISAFNELINAARKRNIERRLAISNDIKN